MKSNWKFRKVNKIVKPVRLCKGCADDSAWGPEDTPTVHDWYERLFNNVTREGNCITRTQVIAWYTCPGFTPPKYEPFDALTFNEALR